MMSAINAENIIFIVIQCCYAECGYAEYRYAEWRYAKCH